MCVLCLSIVSFIFVFFIMLAIYSPSLHASIAESISMLIWCLIVLVFLLGFSYARVIYNERPYEAILTAFMLFISVIIFTSVYPYAKIRDSIYFALRAIKKPKNEHDDVNPFFQE